MNKKDLQERFKEELELHEQEQDVNPLSMFERFYFKTTKRPEQYEVKALEKCVSEKLNFDSTVNSQFFIMKRFVDIKCPICKKNMNLTSGSGHGSKQTYFYKCECGATCNVSMPTNAFEFRLSNSKSEK